MAERRPPTKAQEERAIAAFNARHPVGTRVRFWSGARRGDPSGTGTTISEALLWSRESAVVRIQRDAGGTDYLALTHVEVIESEVSRG